MKTKHIESCLCSITREFPDPKIRLEQYPTSAQLVASIVSFARDDGDLGPGRTALDLGCGTGMLALGCALVECDAVTGVDCDPDALAVAQANAEILEEDVDFILAKVSDQGRIAAKSSQKSGGGRGKGRGKGRGRGRGGAAAPALDPEAPDGLPLLDNCVDTVVTNPPFGTKHNAGMDVRFLKTATRLARRAVYSFHKTSTREYLLRKITSDWGYEAKVVAELKFDIPATYKFHNQKNVDIEVDLIRVDIGGSAEDSTHGEEQEVEEQEAGDDGYPSHEEVEEY